MDFKILKSLITLKGIRKNVKANKIIRKDTFSSRSPKFISLTFLAIQFVFYKSSLILERFFYNSEIYNIKELQPLSI